MNLLFEIFDKPLVDDLAMLAGSQMGRFLRILRCASGYLDEPDDRNMFHSLTPLGKSRHHRRRISHWNPC